ncbi:DinB family protein [Owenweeksia hongkongensis]|uniref:DinB family protein n=1 Tax=Owenweeksia hongkongensis TaxID=253245 RepID=UPI003A93B585
MTREEISEKLVQTNKDFTTYITSLSEEDYNYSYNDKWTAGQQMEHIYKSIVPLNKALMLPKAIMKLNFGKANRPSRSYDDLIIRYKEKLGLGGKAPSQFAPEGISFDKRQKLADNLMKATGTLIKRLKKFTEEDLDVLILPHPLLGKLTLREMTYFTDYHTRHHHLHTIENLKHTLQKN